jgi:hypothetical protein
MSDTKDGVPAVGSRLSGKERGILIPPPDTRQPAPAQPNWPLLYGAVLTELVILIALFYAFTKAFS